MASNEENQHPPRTIPEAGLLANEFVSSGELSEQRQSPLPEVPPMIAASLAAFRRALPELLQKRPEQWVAYHGEECIGFARDSFPLYRKCYERGLKDNEFVVECIVPEDPPDMDIEFSPEVE